MWVMDMEREPYRQIYLTAVRNIERAAAQARSTRAPWATRNLIQARDRGYLQMVLLYGLLTTALRRAGVTEPVIDPVELIPSPDPYIQKLADLGIRLIYASHAYGARAEALVDESCAKPGLDVLLLTIWLDSLVTLTTRQYRYRPERYVYPPPEPLVLIPSIQPNAPSA